MPKRFIALVVVIIVVVWIIMRRNKSSQSDQSNSPISPTPPTTAPAQPSQPTYEKVQVIGPYGMAPWNRLDPLGKFDAATGLSWIWSSGPQNYDPATKYVKGPYSNKSILMRSYDNNSGAAFQANLAAQGDNRMEIFLNGTLVAFGEHWNVPQNTKVTMRPGLNEIEAHVSNAEDGFGWGGFVCAFWKDGSAPFLVSDGEWRWRK